MESTGFQVYNGTDLHSQAAFLAESVIVDNNTSAYLYIPAAGRYASPGSGFAAAMTGTNQLRALWQAPPGKNQPAAVPNEAAQVVFFDSPIPPGTGYAAPSQQSQPWLVARSATSIRQSLGALASVAIVTGVPGQIVTCNHWSLILDALANTSLTLADDTNGQVIDYIFANASAGPYERPKYGFALPAGHGVKLTNGANACIVNACLLYSQQ